MMVVLMITTVLGVMPTAAMMRVVITSMIAIMIMITYVRTYAHVCPQKDVMPYAHVCPGPPLLRPYDSDRWQRPYASDRWVIKISGACDGSSSSHSKASTGGSFPLISHRCCLRMNGRSDLYLLSALLLLYISLQLCLNMCLNPLTQ